MSMREDCVLCGEMIALTDPSALPITTYELVTNGRIDATSGTQRYMHRECSLREVMGGIGHLIAHEFWCEQRHDPDAGLTYRQSAKLVDTFCRVVGMPQ